MKRKLLSILLACSLVLCGCGSSENKEKEQDVQLAQKEENQRYESKELTLPDPLMTENANGSDYIGNEFDGFTADLKGNPAVYYCNLSMEYSEYVASVSRWTLDGKGNWESDELCDTALSDFLNGKYEQVEWNKCTINHFERGDNGSLYAIFTYYTKQDIEVDGEKTEGLATKYSVLEIDEDNDRVFEIPLEVGPEVQENNGRINWEDQVAWITDYHAFEEGNILIVCGDSGGGYGYLIDGETGKTIKELGNMVTGKTRFAFCESDLIYFSKGENKFQVLGIPDLQQENTFGSKLGDDVLGKDWFYYVNPDTWELYLCNSGGIYKVANYQNSDDVERITEPTVFEGLSDGKTNILDFFMGEKDDFYICLVETTEEYGQKSNTFRMLHYTKTEKK